MKWLFMLFTTIVLHNALTSRFILRVVISISFDFIERKAHTPQSKSHVNTAWTTNTSVNWWKMWCFFHYYSFYHSSFLKKKENIVSSFLISFWFPSYNFSFIFSFFFPIIYQLLIFPYFFIKVNNILVCVQFMPTALFC